MVIRTKHYIGDKVWILTNQGTGNNSNAPQTAQVEITGIEIIKTANEGPTIFYQLGGYCNRKESQVFRNLNAVSKYLKREAEKVID